MRIRLSARIVNLEIAICLLLLVTVLALYWQVHTFDFINFDDNFYVTNNPHVTSGLSTESVLWAFNSVYQSNWHPLTWISHMVDVSLYGLNSGQHHMTNVLIHTLNTLLLFFVLKCMTQALWKSAIVAALFAIHPIHVESVAWISERKDVLCGFFWLLCMWVYYWYTQKPNILRYLPIVLFFVMGMMAKPMIVTLPFLLLLLDFWPLNRFPGKDPGIFTQDIKRMYLGLIIEKIPLLILAVVSCVITYSAQKMGGALVNTHLLPIHDRISNALVSYMLYVKKILWPQNLCAFYPIGDPWPFWQVVSAGALFTVFSICALSSVRRFPYIISGWFWFVGTLVPVIGLVQVGTQSMADRYTYVPSIGIFIILTWGIFDLFLRWRCAKWVAVATAISIFVVTLITARQQVQYWANSIVLFEQALDVGGHSYLVHNNLANAMVKKGSFDGAIVHYVAALRASPANALETQNNLGAALMLKGRYAEAIPYLHRVLAKMPAHPNARKNLEEALKHIKKEDLLRKPK